MLDGPADELLSDAHWVEEACFGTVNATDDADASAVTGQASAI